MSYRERTRPIVGEVLISSTAVQHGFGSYPYKWVSHLTPEERAYVKSGGYVVFRSRPAGGNHGTTWRMAYSIRGKLVPRVPPPSVLAVLDAPAKPGWANDMTLA